MSVKKFPYLCQIDGAVQNIRCDRPLIDIVLRSPGFEFPAQAWIDSGCTHTHVNAEIAGALGIDLTTLPEVESGGIHGEGIGYLSELEFIIPDCGDSYYGPVVFIQDLFVPVLLGQNNFFDKFNISFMKSKGFFTIERVVK